MTKMLFSSTFSTLAVAARMIILEDDLEKLMVSKQPVELTCEGYLELSNRLNHLQPHMQASASCWEDSMCQVERMLKRAGSCPGGHNSRPKYKHFSVAQTPILIPI